jgi:hypothetical protein
MECLRQDAGRWNRVKSVAIFGCLQLIGQCIWVESATEFIYLGRYILAQPYLLSAS